jgi:hypothetical protein
MEAAGSEEDCWLTLRSKIQGSRLNSRQSEQGAACRLLLTAGQDSRPSLVIVHLRETTPLPFNSPLEFESHPS